MKFTNAVVLASLASTGLAAHRGRHARFHDAKREAEIVELTKKAIEADPTLEKRCGETVNAGTWGSFPNCWGACASDPACGGAKPAAPETEAAPAAASTPAPAAAPAVSSAAAAPAVEQKNQVKASSAPAAASAAVSSSSSSSGSSSSSSGGLQIGLAYNTASFISGEWLTGSRKATWAYNWGDESGGLTSQIEYIPMLHSYTDAGSFAGNSYSSDYLLSLNEPDQSGGGGTGCSVQKACDAHKQAFANFKGKQISSPAVTSTQGDQNKGLGYLKQFQSLCSDAQVDFVALHYYGDASKSGADQGKDFLAYVESAKSQVKSMYPGKKIWFTETAAMPMTDANVNKDFLDAVLPTLEKDDMVERIAPFMVGDQGALGTTIPSVAGKFLLGL